MFAGEYQVGYGRLHGVEKLHSSSYVNGESQCLILIHNYTYNTYKFIVDIMTCMFMCGRFLSEVVFAYDAKFALKNPSK